MSRRRPHPRPRNRRDRALLFLALVFAAVALCATTVLALIPGASRSRLWVGLPLGMAALTLPALLTALLGAGQDLAAGLGVLALLTTLAVRLLLPRWSWIASQLFASALLSALAYLVYAGALTAVENLGVLGLAASIALLLLEMCALAFSLYYLFEMLDVLGVRDRPLPPPSRDFLPAVALQVPTYNEPVEVVARTLEALARLEYPHLMVQVVDNNTTDPALWRPLEEYCRRLGPRFNFIHLENWPGYKAGALNEATRRLPPDVEVVGIVDSDYTIQPEWLHEVVGYFADPGVAFVQTPQDYRDWKDEPYLRGLYYSYRYFFVLSMPSRAHRNAIIFAGTMGLLRRRALEAVGGWDETCITEDAEASLRMLGTGWSGVYVPRAGGRGMMPLTFDGLKKQRFRWALGGIQILRRHWRDLIGIGDLRLTAGQRFHYLMSGLSWFGDLLQVFFTVLLVGTAVAATVHHQLPIRQVTAAVLAIPLAMLVTGVARALWALRASTGCGWRDAVMAMRVWFSLSWITAMACVRGLLRYQTAFLRTPKAPERAASWLRALAASRTETVIAVGTGLAGVAMLVRSPGVATLVLAVLILWQASVYANAPLAGLAAEGIHITPERRRYLRSSRTTGDRVSPARWAIAVPSAAVVFAVVVAFLLAPLFTQTGSSSPPSGPMLAPPTAIPVVSRSPQPTPTATGAPVATPTPNSTPTPSAAPTVAPTPVSTPAAGVGPSPQPNPTPPTSP